MFQIPDITLKSKVKVKNGPHEMAKYKFEVDVMMVTCSMSLSNHLLRPVGIGPLCFSSKIHIGTQGFLHAVTPDKDIWVFILG